MSVAEKLSRASANNKTISGNNLTIAENEQKVYEAGQKSIVNTFDSLRNTVSGEVIAVNDVLEIPHSISLKVASSNVLPYPYTQTTRESNGITFTDNGDGTITANGTATTATYFYMSYISAQLPLTAGNVYTISGCPEGGSSKSYSLHMQYYNNGSYISSVMDYGNGGSLEYPDNADSCMTRIVIAGGTTVENLVFKPQIKLGSTAYTPYVSDLTAVRVSRYGKNLCSELFKNQMFSVINGETITTVNGVGTDFIQVDNSQEYICSCGGFDSGGNFYCGYYDENKNYLGYGTSKNISVAAYFANCKYIRLRLDCSTTGNPWIQLELGTTATAYEPYISPQTIYPNTAGTVEGVTALSPNMTIITDTVGVTISCEYWRDIDKYVEQLKATEASTLADTQNTAAFATDAASESEVV